MVRTQRMKTTRQPILTIALLALLAHADKATAQSESKTELTVYGHAMLDMGYQFGQSDPNWFDVMRPTKLPSFENEFAPDGSFYSSVRQSRLGVSTSTPTSAVTLRPALRSTALCRSRTSG